jgi:hypothetical protein
MVRKTAARTLEFLARCCRAELRRARFERVAAQVIALVQLRISSKGAARPAAAPLPIAERLGLKLLKTPTEQLARQARAA